MATRTADRRSGSHRYDVVIVGAGMVGATLAGALAGSRLRVALLDRHSPPTRLRKEHELRVSAITRASENVFRALGAWEGMVARRVSPIREMRVWEDHENAGQGSIHFDAAEIGEPHLGHIIENTVVVAALIERLEAADNVELITPAHISNIAEAGDEMVIKRQDGPDLSTRLLVGADGARSLVREYAGIDARGWDYAQQGIVATVRTELPHEETAWQRFLPTGPLAFLPLSDGSCSIVWSNDNERAEALMALDGNAFKRELGEAFQHTLGNITHVSERAAFPLALAHAEHYARPRLVLVGDAAHTIHPLAGQGANLGIADAATLAEVVLDAAAAERDIGALRVVRRYERWRKGENLLIMGVMDAFKRVFGTELAPVRALRDLGLNLTNNAAPIKHLIMRRAMGLEGDLPRLARGAAQ